MSPDDQATETEQLFFQVAMKTRIPTLHHIGICWNCEAPLNEGIYCDHFCAEDHEKQQRAKKYAQI